MANIAITSNCNLNCAYCFTKDIYAKDSQNFGDMSFDMFKKSLDLLKRSNVNQISILGGEPTLHPNFTEFIDTALHTNATIRLFTNGNIKKRILDYLQQIPGNKLNIVVNINNLTPDLKSLSPSLKETLKALNSKIIPGFNIYDKNLNLVPLLELIKKYNLKKKIRLGLAQPCQGVQNQYLPVKHYSYVGKKILDLAKKAQKDSVQLILDCGFVPCMFGSVDFGQFGINHDIGQHCDPIPDILPDGSIVPCYPLSNEMNRTIDEAETTRIIRDEMKTAQKELFNIGIFKTCSICNYKRNGLCLGGCVSHKIMRLETIKKEILN